MCKYILSILYLKCQSWGKIRTLNSRYTSYSYCEHAQWSWSALRAPISRSNRLMSKCRIRIQNSKINLNLCNLKSILYWSTENRSIDIKFRKMKFVKNRYIDRSKIDISINRYRFSKKIMPDSCSGRKTDPEWYTTRLYSRICKKKNRYIYRSKINISIDIDFRKKSISKIRYRQ